ncbi:hypothetical protein MBM_04423 [Drepanopeziza brunnea f. sp. 'multigermtubi' MB_m1]|uniref:Uncharacterized protein n=1 Tax=Marssonina brunnea f. sp. multigermtubi (strain MB_m1) TaxID=1072389 RepID=K1WYA1_MARBU|nr:uncharacterized protein MBM_04423 [Drepanopeziza brunnea f. sp. 'multigermtubi' MB_m1]EKD17562.1 hypothetical protein MBM_04423 [Drepanopeziza brunnea f. sp. 'multigermtubi' MB_m1]
MQFTPLLIAVLASSASAAPPAGFGLPRPFGVAFPGAPAGTPTDILAQEAPAEFFTKGKGAFIQEKPTRSAFGGFPGGSFPTGLKPPFPSLPSPPTGKIGDTFPTEAFSTSLPKITIPSGKGFPPIPTGNGGFGLGGGPKIGFPTTFKTLARPTPSA